MRYVAGLVSFLVFMVLGAVPTQAVSLKPGPDEPAVCYKDNSASPTYYIGGDEKFAISIESCPWVDRDNNPVSNGKCYYYFGGSQGNGWIEDTSCANLENVSSRPTAGDVETGKTPEATGTTATNSAELDDLLQSVINVLSGVVALVFVISLIFAGFQYMSAGGNASQVAAAKNRIVMVVLAFIVFVFGYGLLQWLIPGGIFQ